MKQEQRQRRYKQFAGFPGLNGIVGGDEPQGPVPVKPLTDAERAALQKAGVPHDVEPPHSYTPPPGPYVRPMRIELLGPLGLAAVVLLLFTWLLSVPASGEHNYYGALLSGEDTHPSGESAGEH
jgi:hypothetical protein